MPDFSLRLLNFPIERLLNPRQRLPPIYISAEVWKLLPLKEASFENINTSTDCIRIADFVNKFAFDNISDLQE